MSKQVVEKAPKYPCLKISHIKAKARTSLFKNIFVYLTALGLSCGTWDLVSASGIELPKQGSYLTLGKGLFVPVVFFRRTAIKKGN